MDNFQADYFEKESSNKRKDSDSTLNKILS